MRACILFHFIQQSFIKLQCLTGSLCYLIRDTEVPRILFVKEKCNDKNGNKNEDNFDTFTEVSRKFGNCNTVL